MVFQNQSAYYQGMPQSQTKPRHRQDETHYTNSHTTERTNCKFWNFRGAMGLSAVCDCGISWSYSLTFFKPPPPPMASVAVRSKVVVLLLLIRCWLLLPLLDSVIVLCFAVRYFVHSSFAIILVGKRELDALLCLSPCCLVAVVCFFRTMPRVCLLSVIVVFPGHTHLLCITRHSDWRIIFIAGLSQFFDENK